MEGLVVELPEEIAVRLRVGMVRVIRLMRIMAVARGVRRRDSVTETVGGGELRRVDEAEHGTKGETSKR